MSLATISQDDFAAGIIRGVAPDVMPGVGLANAVNGLYDDDGDVYRRGGTRYFTPAALDAADRPLTFLWSGFLSGQPKIIAGDVAGLYTVDPATKAWAALSASGIAAPARPAVLGDKVYLPNGYVWDGAAVTAWARPTSLAVAAPLHLCAIANRLVVAADNRIAFSPIGDPTGFVADDFHELPGGVLVKGLANVRDTLLVFTNFGLWTITNMAYDLTDAAGNVQQSLALVTPELSLWHEAGLCEWAGQIVAPCLDRIVIVDGVSAPQPITNSIAPYYAGLIAAGYLPGTAKVYRNHLFLPVLDAGEPYAMLACRLDRPVRGRQVYFPWSTLTGHAQHGTALDINLTDLTPEFVLAGRDRKLISLRDVFDPSADVASDADGSTHEFDIESRDFPTGTGQPNHVRKIRLRYTLDGSADITAGYSIGTVAQTYEQADTAWRTYAAMTAGAASYENLMRGLDTIPPTLPRSTDDPERFWYALDAQTPSDRGIDPVVWPLARAERARYIRVRFRTTDAVAKLVLHHLDIQVRQAAHNR